MVNSSLSMRPFPVTDLVWMLERSSSKELPAAVYRRVLAELALCVG
jgi:hypothetical protein